MKEFVSIVLGIMFVLGIPANNHKFLCSGLDNLLL